MNVEEICVRLEKLLVYWFIIIQRSMMFQAFKH